ncbi:MAG: branched-chain amino acid ABC transporter permease [Eubacteriales bacterium]|nr:branched-chain amino acid ABC transporter permease [Eubacteriales bacterium]
MSVNARNKSRNYILIVLGLIVLGVVPVLVKNNYTMRIACQIVYYAVMAGSLNVINGFTNQFSIGHAGFIAVGCYSCVILQTKLGVNFWFSMLIAALITALIGILVALPTLNLSGIYLSFVTLGFSEIIRLVALNWTPVTGGPMGIKGIPVPVIFGKTFRSPSDYYYLFLIVAVLFYFCTHRVINSRVGRAWMSIREDQHAAQSIGVEISRYKMLNFIYATFWAGLIGAFYGPYMQYVDSTLFTLDEGFNVLSMVIIGGMGTMLGPIVGSSIVNLLNEILRPINEYRLVAYGALIILTMWIRPQGIVGASNSVLSGKLTAKSQQKKEAA